MKPTDTLSRVRPWFPAGVTLFAAAVAGVLFHDEIHHWFAGTTPAAQEAAAPEAGSISEPMALQDERLPSADEVTYYTCSMHPSVKSQDPGSCPICKMDLTPVNRLPEPQEQSFADRGLTGAGSTVGPTPDGPRPSAGEIAYHTCSMHPSVKSKAPGTCPICKMDLIPVTYEEIQSGIIFVDAQRRQLIGVRTTTVMEQTLQKEIRAVGRVTYEETALADVSLKFRGWIGEMFADYTGKRVERGEPLFTIYSPDLYTAQQEFLDALQGARSASLLESARIKLRLWDMTEGQIDALAQAGKPRQYVPILSPASGTLIEKTAVRGSAVTPGQRIFRIADLSRVWVEVEVYESDLPLVSVGQEGSLTLPYLPGMEVQGTVSYIYPYLDPKTRTGRLRMVVANPDGALKPEMFVEARLHVPIGRKLAVPEEAILYAGERNIVFLDLGEGRMRPQKIAIGRRAGDLVEVLAGLKAGDTVVTSGNFLVASESKLKSGMDKW